MIDLIYAVFLSFGALLCYLLGKSAFEGEMWARVVIIVWLALLLADRNWATRETSFLYGFLKGILG